MTKQIKYPAQSLFDSLKKKLELKTDLEFQYYFEISHTTLWRLKQRQLDDPKLKIYRIINEALKDKTKKDRQHLLTS